MINCARKLKCKLVIYLAQNELSNTLEIQEKTEVESNIVDVEINNHYLIYIYVNTVTKYQVDRTQSIHPHKRTVNIIK